jgi:hypothetical protein
VYHMVVEGEPEAEGEARPVYCALVLCREQSVGLYASAHFDLWSRGRLAMASSFGVA